MKNDALIFFTDFNNIESTLIVHKNLFINLDKNFDNFIIINSSNFKSFSKRYILKNNFYNTFKFFNPYTFKDLKNFLANFKSVVIISNVHKKFGSLSQHLVLKKLNAPIITIMNLGFITWGIRYNFLKPYLLFKSFLKRFLFKKLILFLTLIGLLAKIEIHFTNFFFIIENAKKKKFKNFFFKKNLFGIKKIVYINSKNYDYYLDNKYNISEDYIVHLDADLNIWDVAEVTGITNAEKEEKHYYYLDIFLRKISDFSKKEVVICIHPSYNLEKTKYFFPQFKVYKNRTEEFIYRSYITTNINSSTLSHAMLAKKKIIMLDSIFMSDMQRYAVYNIASALKLFSLNVVTENNYIYHQLIQNLDSRLCSYDDFNKKYEIYKPDMKGSDMIVDKIKFMFKYNNYK